MNEFNLLVVVGLCVLIVGVESKSKFVTVNLDAKWNSTPIMLEASEHLAKESNDLFWSFVDPISRMQIQSLDYNDRSQYDLIMEVVGSLISPFQLNLLKFALSLRMYSPTVEMYNQIALDRRPPDHCVAFVEINSLITCEIFAIKAFIDLAKTQTKPLVIKNDHYYKSIKDRNVIVILYAQLGTEEFNTWHRKLSSLVDEGIISYVLRHFVKSPVNKKVRLSGYGVELAIKSTEYKAKDDTKVNGDRGKAAEKDEDAEDEIQGFNFSKLKELHPDLKDSLTEFRQHLVDSTSDLAPLKVWQLQDLSFQAAEKIMSAEGGSSLTLLKDISQNFPSRARSLVKTTVSEQLRKEILLNQKFLEEHYGLSAGDSALFINGRQTDLDVYDVFTLIETMMSESRLMEGVYGLGHQYSLESQESLQFLKVDVKEAENNYAVDIRDPSVIYINDLEKDRKYSGWPSSVQDLLRPTFPGMLRHIRKNLFHMVLFVDPADKQSSAMLKMAEAFYVHSAPVRIGLVFVVNNAETVDGSEDAGVALLRAFNYISQKEGHVKALSFLTDVYDSLPPNTEISSKFVIEQFLGDHTAHIDDVFGPFSKYDGQRSIYDKLGEKGLTSEAIVNGLAAHSDPKIAKDVITDNSDYDGTRKESAAFFERTGLGDLPQVLLNGVPLKKEEVRDEFEETVVRTILRLTGDLQKAVYNGFLQDSMDTLDYVMTRNNVMPRLNSRVLGSAEKFLDLSKLMPTTSATNPVSFENFNQARMSGAIAASLKYLTKKDEPAVRPITHWIVADLDSVEGRAFLYEAIRQLRHTNSVRVGLIHNPVELPSGGEKGQERLSIAVAVQAAVDSLPSGMAKSFVTKLLKEENVNELNDGTKTLQDLAVHNMDFEAYDSALKSFPVSLFQSHRLFCEKVLEFRPGERGVITNGKVIGPLKEGEKFIEEDFSLLEKFTMTSSAGKIEQKMKAHERMEETKASDLIMKLEALLLSIPQKEPRKEITLVGTSHSVIKLPPKSDGPAFEVVAVLDPTTRAAQKYTPLIMVLHEVANINVTIFLNCREKLSEMPLKSYYRYVLEPEIDFSTEDSSPGPYAAFYDMPQAPLLTLGMDPPESWLVESVRTPYDLDNIFLEEVDSGVSGDFELEYLLLEGHCYDLVTGNPPRGLQFVLGTNSTPAIVDTIVMANLGYFQLKARPGLWFLQLRSGRSQEIYDIVSQDFTDSPPDSTDVISVMDSFKSKIIRIKVSKKSGKENEDLLSEDEPNLGLWDSISSKFGGGNKADEEESTDAVLNIFSLASGHLYERLLRNMMLSVMNHTKSKVKFWFLKNYLSPSFKDFIPHMANKYGFEYELVQYKWPRWLHQQTEKQRIIWGYKILFLDVLFPLSVNKFIFVDADQTVRADLKELHDLDLEGAPYGYTPFCDSRTDMDGYRFWKSGYWNNHLGHRKYHISALYVVDLKKFRKVAAGDRLRGQYQGLSQDPNSLSNLDQDLPNNMIHQVAIKSLPQEWLWCETWCSDAEKSRAKTIDLCNNPKTKEPKLQAAMRIVSEWKDYDNAVKQLWDDVYRNKTPTEKTDKVEGGRTQTGDEPKNIEL